VWDLILNPFVTVITLLYSMLGNNVVLAIVVFTILIRVLTYPLTIQQQRSMRAQQEVAPKLKKLQEKYKNDREKLASEQMNLYREAGVNPLGGCLPMVLQFPILIALYQAIIYALASTPTQLIGLSGRLLIPGLDHLIPLNNMWLGMDLTLSPQVQTTTAPWALALPALVLVTTWLQYKAMPQPVSTPSADGKPDQAQAMTQSMGTMMPLMFGFFSLSFSVGLSIYFVVGNLIGIVQYRLTPKPAPAVSNGDILLEDSKPKRELTPKPSKPKAK
jgi:YidC/Oxa1 family membrane protein insertase